MKKLMSTIALGLSVAMVQPALAHGEKPRHGGVVSESRDLNFELVNRDGKAVIYILDHGQPFSTAKASGKLTVLNGTERTEAELQPAGDNTLASTTEVPLNKGAKVIASLTLAGDSNVGVRFLVK